MTGEPAPLAIDGELDLHNFSPKEVGRLVREYIEVCHDRGIVELRIIHGKGKGVLRRTVHAILGRHPAVESFRLGGHGEGSWGATMVTLRRGPDGREGEGEGP
ncbi:MAG: Smr/MutS family protein [Myxococcales bacterium]|nr:Smr/MutS family protein [Myxococcales bacterium]